MASTPTSAQVTEALRGVIDPELGEDLVSLGMVSDIEIAENGRVDIGIALTVASCPLRTQLQTDTETIVGSLPGVTGVHVHTTEMNAQQKSELMNIARASAQERQTLETDIPPTARVLAIASGKGGVGKSTVATNLAAAIASQGMRVGVLDADIWGFSVPRMLGIDADLEADHGPDGRPRITPVVISCGKGKLAVVSMGLLADEGDAIMWRGLILNRALQHFLEDVTWGKCDYIVIDLPPGTGDIQMGLARMLPRAEMVIVTTPAVGAQKVASRAAEMARKSHLRVVGVVENMSTFTAADGSTHNVFGSGGGQALSDELGVALLGSIPLESSVTDGSDNGTPVVLTGTGDAAKAFTKIAERITTEVAPPIEMSGCTLRLAELFD